MTVVTTIAEFFSPEPPRTRSRILPVFIPFSGCATRCIFCAQELQTGVSAGSVTHQLQQADALFAAKMERGGTYELGFFGGTFTALAHDDFAACLRFAEKWQQQGLIQSFRCSTRPDCLSNERLSALAVAGCTTVELGIQSFSDIALAASRRGYTGLQAVAGCEVVLDAGFSLGIQLMPGMPGSTEESAWQDVVRAASFSASCARLYPCLVLEGTALANEWRRGGFVLWELDATVEFLARACCVLWEKNITVIRMGLADDEGLAPSVLAGPRHPDLGGMAKGLALLLHIQKQLGALGGRLKEGEILLVPRSWQGAYWGHAGALEARYAALGIGRKNVRWHEGNSFVIGVENGNNPL